VARGESIHLYTTQRHKKTCWAMELLELCATSIFFHLETFGINKKSMSFGVLVDIVSPYRPISHACDSERSPRPLYRRSNVLWPFLAH
jgi:hypothetical protein